GGCPVSDESKAAVTVSEMARLVRLSRAKFTELVRAGIFPPPVYDRGRPVYTEEMQETCLEVRRKNRGINGEPVVSYGRGRGAASKPILTGKDIPALLDGLNSLGLTTATAAQVMAVTEQLYPEGTEGLDQGEVLRAVFLE